MPHSGLSEATVQRAGARAEFFRYDRFKRCALLRRKRRWIRRVRETRGRENREWNYKLYDRHRADPSDRAQWGQSSNALIYAWKFVVSVIVGLKIPKASESGLFTTRPALPHRILNHYDNTS